ncbi:MAG: hypothetical protein DBY05_06925 [Clostridiales bacterium]|nr:MAG: hypothetical protein DBY05_06925 [Clostridiales bacterium]
MFCQAFLSKFFLLFRKKCAPCRERGKKVEKPEGAPHNFLTKVQDNIGGFYRAEAEKIPRAKGRAESGKQSC